MLGYQLFLKTSKSVFIIFGSTDKTVPDNIEKNLNHNPLRREDS